MGGALLLYIYIYIYRISPRLFCGHGSTTEQLAHVLQFTLGVGSINLTCNAQCLLISDVNVKVY